ncbi:DUF411 domain-containing protein [Psychromonas sp. RZ22]|uniref:DUF411 domain-containing protein n=1 Tax=Psychromonas algarum TaxID=2555643 RepID=UPI001068B4D3|nr:DUF411 domain-containing protein [Psychromonas sp. RZ22]TEW54963.1 DUF411 domain-containing protein [Psychromonas sp. RZ22]
MFNFNFNFKLLFTFLFFFSGTVLATEMTVYKSPYCGCCSAWVKHIQAAGISVKVIEQDNNDQLRKNLSMPTQLASCHTAIIDGYVIEGHVPVADIKRLLSEKNDIQGIAVPGMPASSPGMDVEGNNDPYQVIAFDKTQKLRVYNQYNIQ